MRRPTFAAALAVVVGALVSSQALALTVVVEPVASVLVGQPQTFRVASVEQAEGEVMLTWIFGDGSTSGPAADRQATHVYQSAGHYTVIVLAADDVARTSTSFVQTAHRPLTSPAPANSSSIIVDARERRVWNVNPDNDSVSVVDGQTLSLVREIPVGDEPHSLAQAPDGTIWVANQRSDEIVVLDRSSGDVQARIPLPYASQPRALAIAPAGKAYVSLFASGRLVEIDTQTRAITREVAVGPTPAGVSVAADGRIFVTRFISPADHGEVWVVSPATFSVSRTIQLAYDTSADTESSGRGVPNYVSAFVISPDGTQAWVTAKKDDTARGPLRDGQPTTSDNFVRAIVCVIDMNTETELIAEREDIDNRALPVAVAFSPNGGYGYILAMASNWIGISDAYSVLNLSGINRVGSAPDGLALAPDGKLFVSSYLSREVIVYDLSLSLASIDHAAPEALARVRVVEREVLDAKVLLGKQVFFNAADTRMSNDGYMSCVSCHFGGMSDGRVWDFSLRGEGLRNTKSLLGSRGIGQGRVHWSANFDEVQDFERDIREDFEGSGFMPDVEYQSRKGASGRYQPFATPAAGVSPELDALAAFFASMDQAPRSPFRNPDGSFTAAALAGRAVFMRAGCATCHLGSDLTDSAGGALHDVGTLAPTSGKRLGEALVGIDTPSLKGVWQSAPYYHDGRAATLLEVLTTYNVGDRMGVTSNLTATELEQLVEYLLELDDVPEPAPPAIKPAGSGHGDDGCCSVASGSARGTWADVFASLLCAALAGIVIRRRREPQENRTRFLRPRTLMLVVRRSPIAPIAPAARSLCLLASLVFGCGKDRPQALPDAGAGDGGVTPAVDGAAIGACPTVDEGGLDAAVPGAVQDGGGFEGVPPDPGPAKAIDSDAQYPHRTEKLFLSGQGIDDAVRWQFLVTGGRNACKWSTLPVPSHWEFHGFGTFRYGSEARTDEKGIYRRAFDVPGAWSGKRVLLVFEGSMTDTTVTVNGRSAGPTHRGAFYRFRYDVTDLVVAGGSNQLEVVVAKESSDPSVNEAERQADYWVFGGIFRPVYLEAYPAQSIDRVAVNAKADGTLSADVFLRAAAEGAEVTARVMDDALAPVGAPMTATVAAGQSQVTLQGSFAGIRPWTAETPHRYRLAVELTSSGGVAHAHRENFGFRTVEVRAGDGIYVNGSKVRLRGLNRHAFWPESGRALSRRLNWADVALLKSMNSNAVRCSHYPADREFYDAADTLGLYVLDELAGWQSPPYDTEAGRPLIEEMVTFNVNHPSIIFWDNGNEGGWNTALDGEFAKWDPQKRAVLHPWAVWSNVDTDHYESYASTVAKLAASRIYLPTEFLHGLYDGGGGAGLEDYWAATRASLVGAGGFLWAFVDEGVLRADEAGRIDVKGNAAPDGVVGPYRQKEGSFFTIRQIWSPVQIATKQLPAGFTGTLMVGNDYDHTNLDTVSFKAQLVRFDPAHTDGGHTVVGESVIRTGSIPPRGTGALELSLPGFWRQTADAILLSATDATGAEIGRWSWMAAAASATRAAAVPSVSAAAAVAVDASDSIAVSAAGIRYTFSKTSGQLSEIDRDGTAVPLRGPTLSVGTAVLQSIAGVQDGNDYVITAVFTGDLQQMLWRVLGNGWVALTYRYALTGAHDYFGVDFDYPEANVRSVDWLGRGPYRVWKNRLSGPWHDVWHRDRNDAVPGQRWEYPEFKGYFADLRWARLNTADLPITFVLDTDDIFLRLYTPANGANPQTAVAAFPGHDISFLHGIAPIGDKFLAAAATGPQGARHALDGTYEATIFIRAGL